MDNKKIYLSAIVLFIAVIACIFVAFKGCRHTTTDTIAVNSDNSPFVNISSDIVYGRHIENEDYKIFAYDKNTKIVYYMFSNYHTNINTKGGHTFTYFSHYINQNGKLCKYDENTNTVVELN